MNLAFISFFDSGSGSGKALYRMAEGLCSAGHNAYLLVKQKTSDALWSMQIKPHFVPENNPDIQLEKHIQDDLIARNRTNVSDLVFTFPYPGYDLSNSEPILSADVINLRWIAYYQSIETIQRLCRLGKPVVWTMDDMAPFTGGCHQSANCLKYETDCMDCHQLVDNTNQIPSKVLKFKAKRYPENMTIVSPSQWMAKKAKNSLPFRNHNVLHIPNGIDVAKFYPVNKKEARMRLGLDTEKLYLLFGAYYASTVKGVDLVEMLLPKLPNNINGRQLELISFGENHAINDRGYLKHHAFGRIDEEKVMIDMYAAADMFLMPSREENLPNVILEAMSCGTPVAAFKIGGIPEIITDRVDGLLIEPFDVNDMAHSIVEALKDLKWLKKASEAGREKIISKYTLEKQTNAYISLYENLGAMENHETFNYQVFSSIESLRESKLNEIFRSIKTKNES